MTGGFSGLFRKAVDIAQAAAKAATPPPPPLNRKYTVDVKLRVAAANKRAIEDAVKRVKAKVDQVGHALVGDLLGIGENVKLVDVGVEIGKEE